MPAPPQMPSSTADSGLNHISAEGDAPGASEMAGGVEMMLAGPLRLHVLIECVRGLPRATSLQARVVASMADSTKLKSQKSTVNLGHTSAFDIVENDFVDPEMASLVIKVFSSGSLPRSQCLGRAQLGLGPLAQPGAHRFEGALRISGADGQWLGNSRVMLSAELFFGDGDAEYVPQFAVSDGSKLFRRGIHAHYTIDGLVGRGEYGEVRHAVRAADGAHVAIKAVRTAKSSQADLDLLASECAVLQSVSHPHIVSLHEIYTTPSKVLMVLEMMAGGNVEARRMANGGSLPLAEARIVTAATARALAYLHSGGDMGKPIAHRDVKPANILLGDGGTSSPITKFTPIKLGDFGFASPVSHTIGNGRAMASQQFGSPGFFAPELVTRSKTSGIESDCWALGVTLYVLLSGTLPFAEATIDKTLESICDETRSVSFPEATWGATDDATRKAAIADAAASTGSGAWAAAKLLVNSLLIRNVAERLDAAGVCKHPWIAVEHGGSKMASRVADNNVVVTYTGSAIREESNKLGWSNYAVFHFAVDGITEEDGTDSIVSSTVNAKKDSGHTRSFRHSFTVRYSEAAAAHCEIMNSAWVKQLPTAAVSALSAAFPPSSMRLRPLEKQWLATRGESLRFYYQVLLRLATTQGGRRCPAKNVPAVRDAVGLPKLHELAARRYFAKVESIRQRFHALTTSNQGEVTWDAAEKLARELGGTLSNSSLQRQNPDGCRWVDFDSWWKTQIFPTSVDTGVELTLLPNTNDSTSQSGGYKTQLQAHAHPIAARLDAESQAREIAEARIAELEAELGREREARSHAEAWACTVSKPLLPTGHPVPTLHGPVPLPHVPPSPQCLVTLASDLGHPTVPEHDPAVKPAEIG